MENKQLTFYVVEDNFFYQQLIGRMLKRVGAETVYFTSGEATVKRLPSCAPDLVVLDYNLDGTMTGLDTLKTIRQYYPAVYVILFSTRAEINTDENLRCYGKFDFVEKNRNGFSILQQKIRQAISFFEPEA